MREVPVFHGFNFHHLSIFAKAKLFSEAKFFVIIFCLPEVQSGNGVLNRLVPCLELLTCWVLQASLDLNLALYLTSFQFCMGNIKMKRIWQKIFEQTVSFTFPKIHEFGGPPVVPRSLGARLSSCIEDLKAFVIAKFICQFLLSATKPNTERWE